MSDEDREAIRRVQAGETEAFEILVEKYKRKAFRLAYQVLRDQEEALDVAQEAFVKAFRALPRFKGDSAFYTWLFRITMNVALDRKRQRATRAKSMGAEDVPPEEWERTAVSTDPDPEDLARGAERRTRIAEALESLSDQHRSIIILSDIEGLQYREIAEVLGIPMGTVMSRLHHARKRLREALGAGFALVLAVLLVGLGLLHPAIAQPPPGIPGAPAPPSAVPAPGSGQHVCVYVLVLHASHAPASAPGGPSSARGGPPRPGAPPVPGQAPTPDLLNDPGAGPPAGPDGGGPPGPWFSPGGGCGQPVRLRPWVPRLQEVFGYTSFDPLSALEMSMPVGMAQRFALPGGREVEIKPLAVRPPVVRILVRIKRGAIGELATVMDVPPRRPALIGGPPHDGGVLIIAIRARAGP